MLFFFFFSFFKKSPFQLFSHIVSSMSSHYHAVNSKNHHTVNEVQWHFTRLNSRLLSKRWLKGELGLVNLS